MALLLQAVSKSFSNIPKGSTPQRIQEQSFLPLHTSEVMDRGNIVSLARTVSHEADDAESKLRQQKLLLQMEILSNGNPDLIKELASKIPKDQLEEKDENGNTALHNAAAVGNKSAVEALLTSHQSLLMVRNSDDDSPVHLAAALGRRDTVRYLLSKIISRRPKGSMSEDPNRLLDGESGVKLVHLLISADLMDVALEVLKHYPSLVWAKGHEWKTPMETLAHKPDAFRSGTLLRVSDAVLYHYIKVPRVWQYEKRADDEEEHSNWYYSSRLKQLYNLKLVNTHAMELLRFLINQASETSSTKILIIIRSSTQAAVRLGIVEFVGEILTSFPAAIMDLDERGRSLLHQAVLHRQSAVLRLLTDQKVAFPPCGRFHKDEKGNSFLHLAAETKPVGNFIGRENDFEWFQRAEALVSKSYRDDRNKDGKTPREVFTEHHEKLIREVRQYTKEVSSHCATVAALIATVAFACCFTFPGGIDEKGSPNLSTNPRFRGFVCTNAATLVASLMSVVMFLRAFTFRRCQVEESFETVPNIILLHGVLWLFVATGGALVTFAGSLSLMISNFEGSSGVTWLGAFPYVLCVIPVYLGMIMTNVDIYNLGQYKIREKRK